LDQFGLEWDAQMTRTAAVWLSQTVGKALLKLTDEDYNEHGLQELLSQRGGGYEINIEVFKAMQATITGWPGGKPSRGSPGSPLSRPGDGPGPSGASRPGDGPAQRGGGHDSGEEEEETVWGPGEVPPGQPVFAHANEDVFPKRVVVFSPHPDDDVISMGGTFIRLCQQGHEVHVAYQTSGNIAVWDEAALRHADFVAEYCRAFHMGEKRAADIEEHIENFVKRKRPGEVDSPELQQIKGLIRRTEARAAAKFSGVREEHIHFLDMPFYETGRVRKKPLGENDVRIIVDLLERVKPHQVYAAGDLSDPHGTHRVCLAAIFDAARRLRHHEWMRRCEVWLYRGAWQEWGVDEIEMAVPLSPDELLRKRMAVFKHESQKDKALFPGPSDPREFWQRAEDRNRNTAALYDKLGLAEYEAIEGFVRWRGLDGDGE
jgi:glucosamine-6-phosphate deaminase